MRPNQSEQSQSLRKNESPFKNESPHKTTHHYPFRSDPQRFHYHHPTNPGPGTYQQSPQERHTSDYHVTKQDPQWGIPKQYLWIVTRGRELFRTRSEWKGNIGPGKYCEDEPKGKGHSGWSKRARFNYEQWEKKVDLGPGSYCLSQHKSKDSAASSAFKSKTTKSYLDEVVQKQIKSQHKRENPELPLQYLPLEAEEDPVPLPKKTQGSPVFLSKLERLPKTESQEQVGPGSYTFQSLFGKQKRKRLQTDVAQEQFRHHLSQKHASAKIITPGPGAYDLATIFKKNQPDKHPPLPATLKEGTDKKGGLSGVREGKPYESTGKATSGEKDGQLGMMREAVGKLGSVYSLLRQVERRKEVDCN